MNLRVTSKRRAYHDRWKQKRKRICCRIKMKERLRKYAPFRPPCDRKTRTIFVQLLDSTGDPRVGFAWDDEETEDGQERALFNE